MAIPENELRRWRRVFDANAKVVIDGEKCVRIVNVLSQDTHRYIAAILGSSTPRISSMPLHRGAT